MECAHALSSAHHRSAYVDSSLSLDGACTSAVGLTGVRKRAVDETLDASHPAALQVARRAKKGGGAKRAGCEQGVRLVDGFNSW